MSGRRLAPWLMLALLAVTLASLSGTAAARTAAGVPAEPVPSLTPVATERLWTQLVTHPAAQPSAKSAACVPVRAVFYAATDWRRLATNLAVTPSPCAQYYVSVPPLTSDKTQPRTDE